MIPLEQRNINGKNIYIVESHHFAMMPWANLRAQMDIAPLLVSFDHHTDTHDPFLHYCYYHNPNGKQEYSEELAASLVQRMDFTNVSSIENAIANLRFDEHVKTALAADIISSAFIISYDNRADFPLSYQEQDRIDNWQNIMIDQISGIQVEEPQRPFTYPPSNLFMPPIDFESKGLGGEQVLDYALESDFLLEKFNILGDMCPQSINNNCIQGRYILDIDLDYFHTIKSIHPDNCAFFYELIRNSEIITIALERECVEICKEVTENFDSDDLLNWLIEHIEAALDQQ